MKLRLKDSGLDLEDVPKIALLRIQTTLYMYDRIKKIII